MKKFLAMLLIVPLFSLTACGAEGGTQSPNEGEPGPTNVTHRSKIVVDGDTDSQIYEFTTNNGANCVFVDGDQESGLSCNWSVDTP